MSDRTLHAARQLPSWLIFDVGQNKVKTGFQFLIALTAATVFSAEEPKAGEKFVTTHVPNEENWHFVFPAGDAEAYYSDARFALKIESVAADGVRLPVSLFDGLSGHISESVFAPEGRSKMVYRLMKAQFMFVEAKEPKGGMKVGRYEIPMSAKKIEITYRVRYPNGMMSPLCTLISRSSYEFPPR